MSADSKGTVSSERFRQPCIIDKRYEATTRVFDVPPRCGYVIRFSRQFHRIQPKLDNLSAWVSFDTNSVICRLKGLPPTVNTRGRARHEHRRRGRRCAQRHGRSLASKLHATARTRKSEVRSGTVRTSRSGDVHSYY